MKKAIISTCLIAAMVFIATGQATAQQTEDVTKKMIRIEKTEPAPDFLKAGLESITATDSMIFLNFLASDLLEGRETGTRGFEIAAEYAASLFSLWKVKPAGDVAVKNPLSSMAPPVEVRKSAASDRSYFQEFVMNEIAEVTGEITVDIRTGDSVKSRLFRSGRDFQIMASSSESLTAPVVFAGYGIVEKEIGWDDFKGLDVKGKIVLILPGVPGGDDPKSLFGKPELKEKYTGSLFDKSAEILKLGAVAVLQIPAGKDVDFLKILAGPVAIDDTHPIIKDLRRRMTIPGNKDKMPWDNSSSIAITREMADALLENTGLRISEIRDRIDKNRKSASMPLPGISATIKTSVSASLVRGGNVIGFIEGSDPVLKNEVIVIGGHLDHMGRHGDYIFNGADDNGSGSVGILNLARAFALSPRKPKRTVVFCLWTGEEKGLLGSRYYVQNPAFPIDKTIACLNLDMIGVPYNEKKMKSLADRFKIPADSGFLTKIEPESFMSIPLSEDAKLLETLRNADKYVGMTLFPREIPNKMNRMGGSDHAPFGAVGIPWIFFITGGGDEYHQTNDSVDKVSGESIARVSRLIFATAFELADR